jgi:hypothetical protein
MLARIATLWITPPMWLVVPPRDGLIDRLAGAAARLARPTPARGSATAAEIRALTRATATVL